MFNETKYKKHGETTTKPHSNKTAQNTKTLIGSQRTKTHVNTERRKKGNNGRILLGNSTSNETV